jgi:hypothetical protein
MRINLNESGIQNIRSLAKEYNSAKIYFHIDCDGVCSAIAMKQYLESNGIKVIEVEKIQYGGMEYAIQKTSDGVLPVLCDFAHGKPFMKIHTDHHDSQIQYNNTSKHFAHSKSNAGTISTIISPTSIFPPEDIRIIDMVDSAGYSDENIGVEELKNYIFQWNSDRSKIENHLRFGMVVNKILLAYKNKPNFLETIIMESQPSFVSMYRNAMNIIRQHISNGEKGWADLLQLQKNSDFYAKSQKEKEIPNASIDTVEELSYGKNALIGNTIVQIGGGYMVKTGSYDRYTAFKNYPNSEYFIMIWDSIGMMQVSKNNWNKETKNNGIHLGELVIDDIFKNKYVPLLNKDKYNISLLAIKKTMEENISEENEDKAIGFDNNEFMALFDKTFEGNDRIQYNIEKCMGLKPSQIIPNESDSQEQLELKMKIVKFLNKYTIPLSDIILKTSGGHPGITNLNGFAFLNTQQRINRDLEKGKNPYEKWIKPDNYKPKSDDERVESTSLKILRSIAKDVVKALNDKENEIDMNNTEI